MSEIILIDSDEEEVTSTTPTTRPTTGDNDGSDVIAIVSSDSDEDLSILSVKPSEIQFIARHDRRANYWRRPDLNRNRRQETSNSQQAIDHNVCTSAQIEANGAEIQTIKDEIISPSKIKSSPKIAVKSPTEPMGSEIVTQISAQSQSPSKTLNTTSSPDSSQPLSQRSTESTSNTPTTDTNTNDSNIISSLIDTNVPMTAPEDDLTEVEGIDDSNIDESNGAIDCPEVEPMDCETQMTEMSSQTPPEPNATESGNCVQSVSTQTHKTDACIQTSPLKNSNESNRIGFRPLSSALTERCIQMCETSIANMTVNTGRETDSYVQSVNEKANKTNGNPVRHLNFDNNESTTQTDVEEPVVGERYVCSYENCNEVFNNALLHYKHEKRHSRELMRMGIKTFKCLLCPFEAFRQTELIYHNSEHKGIYMCRFSNCVFRAQTPDQLNSHMKRHRTSKKSSNWRKVTRCQCGEGSCAQRT